MKPSILLLLGASSLLLAQPSKPVDFQREVRPILSDNCFHCHGPDKTSRMAGLRLDLKDAAFATRRSGAAIVPGHPEQSTLIARIAAADPARRMPPASAHKALTPAQVDTLRRWVAQGAPWQSHWAYEAPRQQPLPEVKNAGWVRNPIDRFILARLEAQGLSPAPEADRRTLIRRAALDLTGLPPTTDEVAAFLADQSPDAYEKLLDRYLASPRYGEHRARYWLDAARYADTHGIHVDNYREMWPYRDWVIQAFNRNMPFDQFTREQLAGDLLPKPTLEQRIATGFQRCNPTTNEAGIIEDEYAEIYAKDRADTVGAVWLGMTVGCATCHDHKFDPISQKDFYSLGAFFRNTTQQVMDDNIPDTPPIVVVPRPEDRERWNAVSARRQAVAASLEARRAAVAPAFAQWLAGKRSLAANPLSKGAELFDMTPLAASRRTLTEGISSVAIPGPDGWAIPKAPQLDADKPFTIAISFFFPKGDQGTVVAARQDPKDKNRGWSIDVGGRVISLRLYGDEGKNIEIRAGHLNQLTHGTWNHLVVTYDGSRHQSGLGLFLNGRAVPTQGGGNQNVELKGRIDVPNPLLLGKSLPGGAIADFRIFNRTVSEAEVRLLADWPVIHGAQGKAHTALTPADREALLTYYLFHKDAEFQKLAKEQMTLAAEAKEIRRRGAITHVMQERAEGKAMAHILYRGAYDQKRDEVLANTPSILPAMAADQPHNRLGLADWLVSAENPLTARVTANRMWQEIFGDGIVKTADDFGSQGEMPSNQELLDWLAVDLREHNWDLKRFYKQVLLSAAYRQSAEAGAEKIAKDPENRLLSRGPRFRMDGEMVRDYALSSSGLLSAAIGGPSVKPYQPDGVWEAVAMNGSNTRFYQHDHGDKLYRRSVYTFWKRSAPPASMDIFNAPTREACTVRRERTNTPLQALVTMNDVQFVESARALAEKAYRAGADLPARADFLAGRLLARPLADRERAIVEKAYQDYLRYYDSHPAEAKKLLSNGEMPADAAIPPVESAALTMLANQMLNLDEVLNK